MNSAAEKDFYFDEPKQPPILFFTDGRGNFITGKEQQFIRARKGLETWRKLSWDKLSLAELSLAHWAEIVERLIDFLIQKFYWKLKKRTIEKDRLLKTYNGHFQECQDFLERAKKRHGNVFSNTWLSAGDQIKRDD